MKVRLTTGVKGGEVLAIPSKSDAHRLLICAALADKETRINCPVSSLDINATAEVLRGLGAGILRKEDGFVVTPIKTVKQKCLLDCRESGSTLRFLLPVAAALEAEATFVGSGRLPLRPMDELYETLTEGGVLISNGCRLPFSLSGKLRARDYRIGGGVSSQYLSGLLMGLPLLPFDSRITVTGELQSAGYVEMTLHALSRFGVQARRRGPVFEIPGGRPYESPGALTVEGDWSNAAFFFVLGALLEEGVTVKGLQRDSLQGDRAVLSILEKMGAQVLWSKEGIRVKKGTLRGIEIDLKDVPDLAPALAIAGAMAEGKTTFVGAGRLRVKESDRIRSVCAMIRDLGGRAEERQEGFTVYGGLSGGTVFGAGDHRIVMASAVASAVCPVTIEGAEAVSKSYPGFFEDLSSLGGECSFEE